MATYAIGDIQGCFEPFRRLLKQLKFRSARDQLWLTGDLVNRGGESLEVLRWVYRHRKQVRMVLGNHDIHLLALAAGAIERPEAELKEVIEAHDGEILLAWLRRQPLLLRDRQRRLVMVHAGLHPAWKFKQAEALAAEVEALLRHRRWYDRIGQLYGPRRSWKDTLTGATRRRSIASVLTRVRFLGAEGQFDDRHSGPPGSQPAGLFPWFELPARRSPRQTVLFGHWAALGYYHSPTAVALDTGCVWGGRLTAVSLKRLDRPLSVPARRPA